MQSQGNTIKENLLGNSSSFQKEEGGCLSPMNRGKLTKTLGWGELQQSRRLLSVERGSPLKCLLISIHGFFTCFNCMTIFAANCLAVHHPQGRPELSRLLWWLFNSIQQASAECLLCSRKCLGAGDTTATNQPAKTPARWAHLCHRVQSWWVQ